MKKWILLIGVMASFRAAAGDCGDYENHQLMGGDLPFPFSGPMDTSALQPKEVFFTQDHSKSLRMFPLSSKAENYFVVELTENGQTVQGMGLLQDNEMEGVLYSTHQSQAFLFNKESQVFKTEKNCFTFFQPEQLAK